jgi:2-C-methyl-D-erythritol 4-phosphate cytidylyltransferase / 2-C-methyl-D-erythritol 2,4-cyclodiphosphate synthase
MTTCIALVVAAGRGTRLKSERPKQYLPLGGMPLLRRTINALQSHPEIGHVRVVYHPDDRELYAAAVDGLDVLPPVSGGATRQESARLGLESLASMQPGYVLIHDAARPFVEHDLIDRVLDALDRDDGAIPALAVSDTIKRGANGQIEETVDRRSLWRAQTPQGFHYDAILAAHRRAIGGDLPDDAAVAESAGLTIRLVNGSEDNFKVTTADDMNRAERLVASQQDDIRTGQGFDVHAFGPGDHVWLCGVRVPHDHALIGHSDADVGLHALTDAILGGLGAGDIGVHFPPSDPKWSGAPSYLFLDHAASLVAAAGGRVAHVDVTLVCERPKISPHRDAMVTRLAEILALPRARVSVKATTTERLGFTGRGEGIAAYAVATLRLPL